MAQPILNNPLSGKDWKQIWGDEFNGTELNRKRWRNETIDADTKGNYAQSSMHATGNYGINENGEIDGGYAKGKRWAMWMNKHQEKTVYVKDGSLHITGYVSDETDPTCPAPYHPYHDGFEGKTADFTKKIYTGWIDTHSLTWSQKGLIPNTDQPTEAFRYGFVEARVNFEQMKTPAFRFSCWLMPAVGVDNPEIALSNTTYNNNAKDGLEIDLWEVERSPSVEQVLLMKTIGSAKGNGPATHANKFGIDITKGWHTIGLLWEPNLLVWYLDGVEVVRETDTAPQVASYLMFTREGNSGIGTNEAGKPAVNKPWYQHDAGLFARNIGCHLDKIDGDVAMCDYVRIWQNSNQAGNWQNANPVAPDAIDGNTSTVTTPSTDKYFVFDGKTLSWPAGQYAKWNIDIQDSAGTNIYHDTVETNSYTPKVSGKYSIYPIVDEKMLWNQRSSYTDIVVGTTPKPAAPVEPAPAPPPIEQKETAAIIAGKIYDLAVKLRDLVSK